MSIYYNDLSNLLHYTLAFLSQEERTSWINAIESNAPHCSVRGMLLYPVLCRQLIVISERGRICGTLF